MEPIQRSKTRKKKHTKFFMGNLDYSENSGTRIIDGNDNDFNNL
jgi:hypothetical protein